MALLPIGIGIAVGINILAKKFDIPVVIGYIFTGIIVNALFGLGSYKDSSEVQHLAEFGIVFLMFMIGLEFSAEKIGGMKKEVMVFGFLQVSVTTLIFFVFAHLYFDINKKLSLVIASALALSSTAIVLKSLNENRELNTAHGKSILGILIFQDIAVIPILLMIELLGDTSKDFGSLVFDTILSALVVLFILFVPGRKLIGYFLKIAANTKMDEIFVGMMLFIVIGTSMMVGAFGFSYSLGAFLAGMIIAETKYKYQAEADLLHFRDLLLGFFFVTVGLQVNLEYLGINIHKILLLLLVIMLAKAFVIYFVLRFFEGLVSSIKSAVALSQVGEFSFAIFSLAAGKGLIGENLQGILIPTVIFSMILTPFIMKYIGRAAGLLAFVDTKESSVDFCNLPDHELRDHIIVCGYGSFGKSVVKYLKEHGIRYIALDYNLKAVEEGVKDGYNVVFGNIAQKMILENLHIARSVAVIVAIDDTHKIRVICETIADVIGHNHVIVKVASEEEVELIKDLKIYKVIDEKKEVAKILAQTAISCEYFRVGKE